MTTPARPYQPMATPADLRDGPFKYVLTDASPSFVDATLTRASRNIEARCARKFVPFYGLVQTERAEGIALDSYGTYYGPQSMMATLQLSRADAYGGLGNLVRDVWLDEHAPLSPDAWSYSDVSVEVTPQIGGPPMPVAGALEGPYPDTGHMRLPLGTYCPVGSIIRVTYSGGYTVIPDDLVQAAIMQTVKLLILTISPERRASMSTDDLDAEIDMLIAPYVRA